MEWHRRLIVNSIIAHGHEAMGLSGIVCRTLDMMNGLNASRCIHVP